MTSKHSNKITKTSKSSSKVISITNVVEYQTFKKKLCDENEQHRGVIFYSAGWCEACKLIKPLYTRIANRYYKRIMMAYVDIDICGLDFSKVPVFVSFYKETQINSMEGANNRGLKEFIKEAIQYNSRPKQTHKSKHKSEYKGDIEVILTKNEDNSEPVPIKDKNNAGVPPVIAMKDATKGNTGIISTNDNKQKSNNPK